MKKGLMITGVMLLATFTFTKKGWAEAPFASQYNEETNIQMEPESSSESAIDEQMVNDSEEMAAELNNESVNNANADDAVASNQDSGETTDLSVGRKALNNLR